MMKIAEELTQRARRTRYGYPDWLKPEVIDALLDTIYGAYGEAGEWPLDPVTAIPKSSFESFKREGYKTVYRTGPTWHQKYSPLGNVMEGRVFNDMRLYGQTGIDTVYAVGLSEAAAANDVQERSSAILKYLQSYAPDGERIRILKWNAEVLDYATFCYGDCQQGPLVWPYDPRKVYALGMAVKLAESLRENADVNPSCLKFFSDKEMAAHFRALFLAPQLRPNPYFEVQIHKQLTIDDVEEIM